MRITVLCAPRGGGKTAFLQSLIAAWVERGCSVGGVAAPAVFDGDQRVGYDLLDLRSGRRRPLARAGTAHDSGIAVGPYHFDREAIVEGGAAILAAVRDRADVVAIDEIGPLEFDGGGWAPALESALHACQPIRRLLVTVRPTLVDRLPVRFPAPAWSDATRICPPWPAVPDALADL